MLLSKACTSMGKCQNNSGLDSSTAGCQHWKRMSLPWLQKCYYQVWIVPVIFFWVELSQPHTTKDPSKRKQPHIPFRMSGSHGTGMKINFSSTHRCLIWPCSKFWSFATAPSLALTGHTPQRPLHLCTVLGPHACCHIYCSPLEIAPVACHFGRLRVVEVWAAPWTF